MTAAHIVGVEVFVTGGIGGVHRHFNSSKQATCATNITIFQTFRFVGCISANATCIMLYTVLLIICNILRRGLARNVIRGRTRTDRSPQRGPWPEPRWWSGSGGGAKTQKKYIYKGGHAPMSPLATPVIFPTNKILAYTLQLRLHEISCMRHFHEVSIIGADPEGSGGSADPQLFVVGGQLMVLRPPLLSDHSDEYCLSDETIHIRTLQPYNNSNTKSVKMR